MNIERMTKAMTVIGEQLEGMTALEQARTLRAVRAILDIDNRLLTEQHECASELAAAAQHDEMVDAANATQQ